MRDEPTAKQDLKTSVSNPGMALEPDTALHEFTDTPLEEFTFRGVDCLYRDEEYAVSLTKMWLAAGSPWGREPWRCCEGIGGKFLAWYREHKGINPDEAVWTIQGEHGFELIADVDVAFVYGCYLDPEFAAKLEEPAASELFRGA